MNHQREKPRITFTEPMNILSKSELLASRQCPKRLWLEIKKPELRIDAPVEKIRLNLGQQLKAIARRLYDTKGDAETVVLGSDGEKAVLSRSRALLTSSAPIFDAVFSASNVQITADVMLPSLHVGNRAWHLLHVRTSTLARSHHYDDLAVQAFVARRAGVPLVRVGLAHIDGNWTYTGDKQYQGLLVVSDMTAKVMNREDEIHQWVLDAERVLNRKDEPDHYMGSHCNEPHACGFQQHCRTQERPVEYPISWLPRSQSAALKAHLDTPGTNDMRQVPSAMLDDRQRRVKEQTLSGGVFFDSKSAAADLAPYNLPVSFLAFESVQFGLPTWKNTRPFQHIAFQFSVHWLGRTPELEHESFIDLSGNDPSLAFAEALIAACGNKGTIFAYNAGFEMSRIRELADRFPRLRIALLQINERIVDLLKVAERRYYHPEQEGSWSIKKILPTIAPEMMAERLYGIKDGVMAKNAYLEIIEVSTSSARKAELKEQLLNYCRLDTLAMVRLWHFFKGLDFPQA